MLQARLLMGTVLIALTLGVLVLDGYVAPYYPFLLGFQLLAVCLSTGELLKILEPRGKPHVYLAWLGVLALTLANWAPVCPGFPVGMSVWTMLAAILTGFVLTVFLYELIVFTEAGHSVERLAMTGAVVMYLGWLPSCFAQIRWLNRSPDYGATALGLTIFVAKFCDVGAYTFGRLFGRRKMAPTISPKKTWEGAVGGILTAAVLAIGINRLAPTPALPTAAIIEVGFGVSVACAGMIGDLAESLIKRDCQVKDASALVPGFGGMLDVVDSLIFAGPVAYAWFLLVPA